MKTEFNETEGIRCGYGDNSSLRTKEEMNDYRYFPEPGFSPT